MRRALAWALVLLALLAAAFCGGLYVGRNRPVQPPIIQIDTLYRVDTIRAVTPVYVRERVVDTLLVQVRDTLVRRDTTFVRLPRTARTYADSTYRAVVSGYLPALDSIEVYQRTQTITRTITQPDSRRWALGLQAGLGLGPGGATPYLGIGISYDLLRF